MKRLRTVSLSMALDKSMIKNSYIHFLSITLVLMAVAKIFLLSINIPRTEGKFTLSYAPTFRNIPTRKT